MRRRTYQNHKKRRTTRRRARGRSNKRGGFSGFNFPEPSNIMKGGSFIDSRYTFSQPVVNVFRSGAEGVSNVFNDFMGRSHAVSSNVSDQPYLM